MSLKNVKTIKTEKKRKDTRKGARVAVILISVVAVALAAGVLIMAYRMPTDEAEAYIEMMKAFEARFKSAVGDFFVAAMYQKV